MGLGFTATFIFPALMCEVQDHMIDSVCCLYLLNESCGVEILPRCFFFVFICFEPIDSERVDNSMWKFCKYINSVRILTRNQIGLWVTVVIFYLWGIGGFGLAAGFIFPALMCEVQAHMLHSVRL